MNNSFNLIDERNKGNTNINIGKDSVESIGRRRISGIVALDEKKHNDKARKLVLALPIPSDSFYHVNKRHKGKAKIDITDPMDGFTKYQKHGLNQKGLERKEGGQVRNVTTIRETHKRNMYWTPSEKTSVSEFLNLDQSNIQLNSNYKDSLSGFVKDLHPVVKKFATKKLESLKFEKLQDGNTPISDLPENDSATQTIHQCSPQAQAQAQPNTFNSAQIPSLSVPFLNKPWKIPGTATQQLIMSNTLAGTFNTKYTDYKGKKILKNCSWNAFEPNVSSSLFCDDIQEKNQFGSEISNESGIMSTFDLTKLKGKFDSPQENMHGKTRKWKSYTSVPDMLVSGSPRSGLNHVYQTGAVSGPQQNRLEHRTEKCLSCPSIIPQIRLGDTMPRTNLPNLSHISRPRPKGSMCETSDYKPLNLSHALQEVQEDSIPTHNFLQLFSTSDPRQGSPVALNKSFPFCLSQPRLEGPMFVVPRNNLPELSLEYHQPCPEAESSSAKFGTPDQHEEFQAKMGSPNLNNNSYPSQVNSRASPLNSNPFHIPKAPSTLGSHLDVEMNHYGRVLSPIGQPKDINLDLP